MEKWLLIAKEERIVKKEGGGVKKIAGGEVVKIETWKGERESGQIEGPRGEGCERKGTTIKIEEGGRGGVEKAKGRGGAITAAEKQETVLTEVEAGFWWKEVAAAERGGLEAEARIG